MSLSYKLIPSPIGKLKLVASDEGLVAILWENDRPRRVRLADLVENPAHPMLLRTEKELNGACQRLLDRCSRNLLSFLFVVPIPGFSQKISRQEAAGATIASSLDPQHPGFCELHFMRAAC